MAVHPITRPGSGGGGTPLTSEQFAAFLAANPQFTSLQSSASAAASAAAAAVSAASGAQNTANDAYNTANTASGLATSAAVEAEAAADLAQQALDAAGSGGGGGGLDPVDENPGVPPIMNSWTWYSGQHRNTTYDFNNTSTKGFGFYVPRDGTIEQIGLVCTSGSGTVRIAMREHMGLGPGGTQFVEGTVNLSSGQAGLVPANIAVTKGWKWILVRMEAGTSITVVGSEVPPMLSEDAWSVMNTHYVYSDTGQQSVFPTFLPWGKSYGYGPVPRVFINYSSFS